MVKGGQFSGVRYLQSSQGVQAQAGEDRFDEAQPLHHAHAYPLLPGQSQDALHRGFAYQRMAGHGIDHAFGAQS